MSEISCAGLLAARGWEWSRELQRSLRPHEGGGARLLSFGEQGSGAGAGYRTWHSGLGHIPTDGRRVVGRKAETACFPGYACLGMACRAFGACRTKSRAAAAWTVESGHRSWQGKIVTCLVVAVGNRAPALWPVLWPGHGALPCLQLAHSLDRARRSGGGPWLSTVATGELDRIYL